MISKYFSRCPWLLGLFGLGVLAGASRAPAQQALVISDGFRPTVSEGAAALSAMLQNRGLTVDQIVLLPFDDPGPLEAYGCVWDVRVDSELGPFEQARYEDYLVGGGAMYLAGEHGSFAARNLAVAGFLDQLGGGPVTVDTTPTAAGPNIDLPEAVNLAHPISLSCDPVTEVIYDGIANGAFFNSGTGVWLTRDGLDVGAAVWDPGSLAGAPQARVVSVLDSNYLSDGPTGTLDWRIQDRSIPTQNRAFVTNLISYLCDTAQPTPECVCEPLNHGWWHRWCLGSSDIDPGRNGRGQGPPPRREAAELPSDLEARVDALMAEHMIGGCEALDAGPFADTRLAALRELATLYFNLEAGWLQLGCPVELRPVVADDGLLVADALRLMLERLALASDDANKEARWIGEHVVNREALR